MATPRKNPSGFDGTVYNIDDFDLLPHQDDELSEDAIADRVAKKAAARLALALPDEKE